MKILNKNKQDRFCENSVFECFHAIFFSTNNATKDKNQVVQGIDKTDARYTLKEKKVEYKRSTTHYAKQGK